MPPNKHSLNIVLHALEDRPTKYHWGFYIPDSRTTEIGDLYHCTNFSGLTAWAYLKIPSARVLHEEATILAFEIGVIPDGFGPFTLNRRRFEMVVAGVPVGPPGLVGASPAVSPSVDGEIGMPGTVVTPRMWVTECVRRLVAEGMLLCADPKALEDEVIDVAHLARARCFGEGKAGVYELGVSTVCKGNPRYDPD